MPVVNNMYSLRAGIQKDLMDIWRQRKPVFEEQQKLLCKFLPWVSLRNASYVFKEAVPFPSKWPYGKGRTRKTFKDVLISLSLYPYEITIPFSGWDREDDQLGDMKQHVATVVDRFLQLPDKLIAEYLNNSASLNPSIANAYDGVSLFSATDGDGAARFGVTGGNIISGSGAVNVAAFVHDLFVAQRRLQNFLDPASMPIYSPSEIDYPKLHVIVPTSYNEVVINASKAQLLRTDTGSVTGQSNVLMGTFIPHINPYLTDTSDWFVAVEHPYYKAFAYRAPKTVRQVWEDLNNSDRARETNEEAFMGDIRTAIGPLAPFTMIKVNY